MKTEAIFAEITARIVAQMETGVRPWSKPWDNRHCVGAADLPRNIEGRPYRGANVFWLWLAAQSRGYEAPVWLTYKQAEARGANVRKGEKGTPVFFWSRWTKEDKETGEKKSGRFAKGYTVFNIAQCEGIETPAPRQLPPEPERVAAAEALIAATGARIQFGGAEAFYAPGPDMIQIPNREAFKDSDGFYSTAFHEIGHWTGHASRLNRVYGKRFGDDAYAFEELVAELTAALVCASQGFVNVEREDHAAYLANWLKVLKGDPKAFAMAAGQAQKAADLILGTYKVEAEEEPSEAEAAPALALAA